MFQWLKKLVAGQPTDAASPPTVGQPSEPTDFTDTVRVVSAWEVVDCYLQANPQSTPYGVEALIRAGATELLDPSELMQACERIEQHGYGHPINPTLQRTMEPAELLAFLRWQAARGVDREAYANEARIVVLIEQFRAEP